jgi:hypothetical protein
MVTVSGALIVVALALFVVGAVGGTGFVYASIVVSLAAAALLPFGIVGYTYRNRRRPASSSGDRVTS